MTLPAIFLLTAHAQDTPAAPQAPSVGVGLLVGTHMRPAAGADVELQLAHVVGRARMTRSSVPFERVAATLDAATWNPAAPPIWEQRLELRLGVNASDHLRVGLGLDSTGFAPGSRRFLAGHVRNFGVTRFGPQISAGGLVGGVDVRGVATWRATVASRWGSEGWPDETAIHRQSHMAGNILAGWLEARLEQGWGWVSIEAGAIHIHQSRYEYVAIDPYPVRWAPHATATIGMRLR